MSTGNLYYHLYIMSQCLEIVAEYLQCREGTEYDDSQILAVLDLDMESKPSTHGQMTAIIRYHTPFL